MKKVTWTKIEELCKKLAREVQESGIQFNAIYGIPRGGLVPATILSHLLDLPLLTTDPLICCRDQPVLLVDDINDTGNTLMAYCGHQNTTSIVLFQRKSSDVHSDFVGEQLDHEEFLLFPWECEDKMTEDMNNYYKSRGLYEKEDSKL